MPSSRLLWFLFIGTNIHAFVTEQPTFAEKLDRLYEKLEKFSVTPTEPVYENKLYAKLEKLNSLTPDKVDSVDDDEELLNAMQLWGAMSPDQLSGLMKDMQMMKDEERSDKLGDEYSDGFWNDEEFQSLGETEYAMDDRYDWETDDDQDHWSASKVEVVTPSAIIRQDPGDKEVFLSAVEPIAATHDRPRILDDYMSLSPSERVKLRHAAIANMASVVRDKRCLTPQPRWFTVRHLAPAANTVYMPPCVQLHRCAPDSGCCYSEEDICAPVEGKYVAIPFHLNKADGSFSVSRILFYNHTQCACVSRETLQTKTKIRTDQFKRTERVNRAEVNNERSSKKNTNPLDKVVTENHSPVDHVEERKDFLRERQSDWRAPTEEPKLDNEDEITAPTQMRRCTCPGLFIARIVDANTCSCVCDWPDLNKRRDCLSLARGHEHFGLRDRVCVANGDCNLPSCEYGRYERNIGKCPVRRSLRFKTYHKRYQPDKTIVV